MQSYQPKGSLKKSAKIPLLFCSVPAGFPSPADDYIEAMIDLHEFLVENPAATYLMRAQGLSMIDGGILPEDLLVVDRSLSPHNGDVIVAVVDGDFNVKRLDRRRGKIMLLSDNADYPPIVVPKLADLEIWGVVTTVIHQVKRCSRFQQ